MKAPRKKALMLAVVLAAAAIAIWTSRRPVPVTAPKASSAVARQQDVGPDPNRGTRNSNPPASTELRRKFIEMDVLERNAVLMEIENQDLPSIFRVWLEAGRVEKDLRKQLSIQSTMAGVLQITPPNPAFLKQVEEFIRDGSNSMSERQQLISVLGSAATKESVESLLRLAMTLPEQALRVSAYLSIRGSVGPSSIRGDGSRHEELSPPLEQAWRESQDQHLISSIAVALAHVGAPSAIRLLLAEATNEKGDNVRTQAARMALEAVNILNPNGVPPLAALLSRQAPSGPASRFAADTLNRSGIPAATEALLQWLRNADDSVAPWAYGYAENPRTPVQLQAWKSASDPAVSFRSEKVRDAIREGFTKYQQSIKFER